MWLMEKCQPLSANSGFPHSPMTMGGRGLRGYPNETAFSLDDPHVRELEGCLVAILTEGETYAV